MLRRMAARRRWLGVALVVAGLWCIALWGAAVASALPAGRAYELVSPVDKNGGSVVPDSRRTRAAAGGGAVGFISLSAFGDAVGTGIATDYVSVRKAEGSANAGSGWATHAITPLQSATTFDAIASLFDPRYVGEFTANLDAGVFFAASPVTDDPSTASVPNLYRRSDLLSAGSGAYALVSACPLCESSGRPLEAIDPRTDDNTRPLLAAMSPDGNDVTFESTRRLTADTPFGQGRFEVYEWRDGSGVQLVGRIPRAGSNECDDDSANACVASAASIAAQGAGPGPTIYQMPHVLSDGSDGHSRAFFTRPTAADGTTLQPNSSQGQLFMRLDGHATVQLNASERRAQPVDTTAPATFLDASADGLR